MNKLRKWWLWIVLVVLAALAGWWCFGRSPQLVKYGPAPAPVYGPPPVTAQPQPAPADSNSTGGSAGK